MEIRGPARDVTERLPDQPLTGWQRLLSFRSDEEVRDGNATPYPSPHPSTSLPFTHKAGTVARKAVWWRTAKRPGADSSQDDSEKQNLGHVSGGTTAATKIDFSFCVTSQRQTRSPGLLYDVSCVACARRSLHGRLEWRCESPPRCPPL